MLWWLRRDLRLADNPALVDAALAARRAKRSLAAVFVVDPRLFTPSAPNRLAFLLRSLHSLQAAGLPLIIRTGDPTVEIPRLAAELDAPQVFITADYAPYGRRRDRAVHQALRQQGRDLIAAGSPYAVDPGTLETKSRTPFRVFTPFHRAWLPLAENLEPHRPFDLVSATWRRDVRSDALPSEPLGVATHLPTAGEKAAHDRWSQFLERLDGYATDRDRPDRDGSSRLSAYLKFGVLHPRQLLPALRGNSPGSGAWVFRSELAWREFYADVLCHWPASTQANLNTAMNAMRVDRGSDADQRFEAWATGRTGYPFVDAGMRQLLAEGWMHNRLRMVTASFLVKHLHLPWQRGAAWFMRHLVDGDIASNQHGWQWTAGTGTDAAPYFRVFNPTAQGRRFDPDAVYIRSQVAELAAFEGDVHQPQQRLQPSSLLNSFPQYPSAIVDLATERSEALARLDETKR